MPLKTHELRRRVEALMKGPPRRTQNAVARELGTEPSNLSRWLDGRDATYPRVHALADRLGIPVRTLWEGPIPRRYANGAAPPAPPAPLEAVQLELGAREVQGGLWVVERMSLALADIARQLRAHSRKAEAPPRKR
jgi:hypothetical protein